MKKNRTIRRRTAALQEQNDLVAEYSLKDMSKPIGVSAYQVTSKLPEELEKQLPSVEDIRSGSEVKQRKPKWRIDRCRTKISELDALAAPNGYVVPPTKEDLAYVVHFRKTCQRYQIDFAKADPTNATS